MSQTALQPGSAPAPTTAPPQVQAADQVAKPTSTTTTPVRQTPQQLRGLSLGLVVIGIVVGLVGALTFSYLAYSLSRAEADTTQLIRVQTIQTNLLSADATATNAFLVGGLEPATQREAYDQAISSTSALIAEAARAQPADAEALAALNQEVVAYAATIEQARANNRQGFPVGSQYLRSASADLRVSALPILDLLVSTNAERAADEMDLRPGYLFVVVALLGLVAIVLAHQWLARRFRRRINVGVLAGAILLLAGLLGGFAMVQQSGSAVTAVREGSFADVNAGAEARIEANNAKASESLTLIARGSGSAFEQAWVASADKVRTNLGLLGDADLPTLWTAYTDTHTEIRELDDGGSWDKAVATATGTDDASANTTFNAFDAELATYLDGVSTSTATALGDRQPGLVIAAVFTLLAGVGAGLLGRWGVAARLKEYR
ncbi:MAG TPA: hypothetical protein VIT20_04630 [Propionibacteriaceae bacterium]